MKAERPNLAVTLIATWFGCGFAPAARGTWGSAAAILLSIPLAYAGWRPLYFLALAAVLTPFAIWSATRMERQLGRTDPPQVVVDEVVGQWIALAGATSLNWKSWLAAFVLFRIFDIRKPPPVRQCERLPGGYGIVADDAMAGVYAALVLAAAGWFNLY